MISIVYDRLVMYLFVGGCLMSLFGPIGLCNVYLTKFFFVCLDEFLYLNSLEYQGDGPTSTFGEKFSSFFYNHSLNPFLHHCAAVVFSGSFRIVGITMEPALPIDDDGVTFDPSVETTGDISNMTVEQYMAWVRYQANALPLVTRADIDSSSYAGKQTQYMPKVEMVASCPEQYLPKPDWERDVIATFSELRAMMARLAEAESSKERSIPVPQLKDEKAWHKFCLGAESSTEATDSHASSSSSSSSSLSNARVTTSSSACSNAISEDLFIEQRKLELSRSFGVDMDIDVGQMLGTSIDTETRSLDATMTGEPGGGRIGGIPITSHANIDEDDEDVEEEVDEGVDEETNGGKKEYPEWTGILSYHIIDYPQLICILYHTV